MANWVRIARVDECPVGAALERVADERVVAIYNVGGAFHALDGVCPHQGGPLGEGELAGTVVTCPWHEWRFDARTGVNTDDATCKVTTYPVKVEGDAVLVQI